MRVRSITKSRIEESKKLYDELGRVKGQKATLKDWGKQVEALNNQLGDVLRPVIKEFDQTIEDERKKLRGKAFFHKDSNPKKVTIIRDGVEKDYFTNEPRRDSKGDLIPDKVEVDVKRWRAKTNIKQIDKCNDTLKEYSSKLQTAFGKGLDEVQKTMEQLDKALDEFDIEEGEVLDDLSQSEVDRYEAVVEEANVLTIPTTVGVLDEKGWEFFGNARTGLKLDDWGRPIIKK